MTKEEEFKKFKKDINFNLNLYSIGIAIFVVINILAFSFVIHSDMERIQNIECTLGIKDGIEECVNTPTMLSYPDPLEGWEEVCMENKTTEYKDFKVMGDVIWDCVSYYNDNYCYNETIEKWNNFGDMLSMRVWYNKCFDEREESFSKFVAESSDEEIDNLLDSIGCYSQFIVRWNETVCIKKMLVKEE